MKALAALHYRVGPKSGALQALFGNLDLSLDHMSIEGSLAFNCDDCHAYSMRDSRTTGCNPASRGTTQGVLLQSASPPMRRGRIRNRVYETVDLVDDFANTVPYSRQRC